MRSIQSRNSCSYGTPRLCYNCSTTSTTTTQTVRSLLPITGTGTLANPITLYSVGATAGQGYIWNGTTWVLSSPALGALNYYNDDTAAFNAGLPLGSLYVLTGDGPYGQPRNTVRYLQLPLA